jgi:C1A family cysteine protease
LVIIVVVLVVIYTLVAFVKTGACDSNKLQHHAATITGYRWVESYSEQALMLAVASQPVIVAINARADEFKHYRGGIYDRPCGTNVSHTVVVVGYGDDEVHGLYWMIRNSWGGGWGEGGYMFLRRGVPPAWMCGLTIQAIYPVM